MVKLLHTVIAGEAAGHDVYDAAPVGVARSTAGPLALKLL